MSSELTTPQMNLELSPGAHDAIALFHLGKKLIDQRLQRFADLPKLDQSGVEVECCWVRVHEHLRQHREDLAGTPVCGASLRTLLRRLAEHRRARIYFFQILHDRG